MVLTYSFERTMRTLLIMLLALSGTTVANAQFHDGNSLHLHCGDAGVAFSDGVCAGYVIGVVDTYMLTNSFRLCLPSNVTAGQLQDVVVKYLRDRPDQRHYSASSVVWTALDEVFPC